MYKDLNQKYNFSTGISSTKNKIVSVNLESAFLALLSVESTNEVQVAYINYAKSWIQSSKEGNDPSCKLTLANNILDILEGLSATSTNERETILSNVMSAIGILGGKDFLVDLQANESSSILARFNTVAEGLLLKIDQLQGPVPKLGPKPPPELTTALISNYENALRELGELTVESDMNTKNTALFDRMDAHRANILELLSSM